MPIPEGRAIFRVRRELFEQMCGIGHSLEQVAERFHLPEGVTVEGVLLDADAHMEGAMLIRIRGIGVPGGGEPVEVFPTYTRANENGVETISFIGWGFSRPYVSRLDQQCAKQG